MIIFEIYQKLFRILGVDIDTPQGHKVRLINLRTVACSMSKVIFFSTSAAYLVLRANSSQEYGKNYTHLFRKPIE